MCLDTCSVRAFPVPCQVTSRRGRLIACSSDTLLDHLLPSPLKTWFLWKAVPSALRSSLTPVSQSVTAAALALVALVLLRSPELHSVLLSSNQQHPPQLTSASWPCYTTIRVPSLMAPKARELFSDWSLAFLPPLQHSVNLPFLFTVVTRSQPGLMAKYFSESLNTPIPHPTPHPYTHTPTAVYPSTNPPIRPSVHPSVRLSSVHPTEELPPHARYFLPCAVSASLGLKSG